MEIKNYTMRKNKKTNCEHEIGNKKEGKISKRNVRCEENKHECKVEFYKNTEIFINPVKICTAFSGV